MQYAIYLPTFGDLADARALADLAAEAEAAGWDGCFLWDHLAMWWDDSQPVVDSTVALAAVAMATERIRIGPIVTALPRRRPWKVARETATLDQLSGGRMILGVGLGANRHEFEAFGEEPDLRVRGAMVDEALTVITGLWTGEPFSHAGRFYSVAAAQFRPPTLQTPRIPIWVATSWPNRAPQERAWRWDGAIATMAQPGPFNVPTEAIAAIRAGAPDGEGRFDIALANGNPQWNLAADAAEAARYEDAGLTWWLEDIDPWRFGGDAEPPWQLGAMRERILAGPPRR